MVYRNIRAILGELKPIELDGDSKLQAILFVVCPQAEYSVLLNFISLPVILVGISLEITSKLTLDDKKV